MYLRNLTDVTCGAGMEGVHVGLGTEASGDESLEVGGTPCRRISENIFGGRLTAMVVKRTPI